jgi:hypothetical protein
MADNPINPDDLKQIIDLTQDLASKFADVRTETRQIDQALNSFGLQTADVGKEFTKLARTSRSIQDVIANMATDTRTLEKLEQKRAAVKVRQERLERKSQEYLKQARDLTQQANQARIAGDTRLQASLEAQAKATMDQAQSLSNGAAAAQELANQIDKAREVAAELDKNVQGFDKIATFMDSIPGLKAFSGPFKEAREETKKLLLEGKSSAEALAAGLEKSAKNIGKMIALFALKSLFEADQQITEIQKNTESGAISAFKFRTQLSGAALATQDLRVNTLTLIKANEALNKAKGTALQFDTETLITAAKILDAEILTEEALNNIVTLSNINGVSLKESLKTQENAVNEINKEFGTRVSLKSVLEDSNKITGQLRANLGANPESISRAVVKAKALGMELSDIKDVSKSLLDFESSIEAELEAELLTGKQLNLERARAAALSGDIETLTSEINNNVGDFGDFMKMNVLQQDALAKSFGMSSDQLSDILLKEADLESLKAEAIATGDEQTLQDLEKLSNQEKFAKAVENIKSTFVDLMAILSPITNIVGFLAEAFNTLPGKIGLMVIALAKMSKILKINSLRSMAGAIAEIFKGQARIPGVGLGLALAATGALVALYKKFDTADDLMLQAPGGSGYGKRVISAPEGTFALNNNDTIIAGTDLFRANDVAMGPTNSFKVPISQQPIVIQNTFSNFQSSGPYALAETQRRQASPTFA